MKSGQENQILERQPGDVIVAEGRVPDADLILQGFKKRPREIPRIEPFVSFDALKALLDFLEFVVLTERIILPLPEFSRRTEKLIASRKYRGHFYLYRLAGELDCLNADQIIERLSQAGILFHCKLGGSADDVLGRHLPRSRVIQGHFGKFLGYYPEDENAFALASAFLACMVGVPLHLSEIATQGRVPYALSEHQEKYLQGYEAESLRTRKSVTQLLLDRLNGGAKKEVQKLAEIGAPTVFPETPIASMILQRANTPLELLDAAVELRNEFKQYRCHMNELERDLLDPDTPLKTRIKRKKELEHLAASLWPDTRTDFRATAVEVSEAMLAVPEVVADPSVTSIGRLAAKLASLPVDRVVQLYRRRKVRLLLKAKRQFLASPDLTSRIAHIFDVPRDIVIESRKHRKARLTAAYAAKHPEIAEQWDDFKNPLE